MTATKAIAKSVDAVLAALRGTGQKIVAPIREDGVVHFAPLTADAQPVFDEQSRWSPKEVVFPKTEKLITYQFNHIDVKFEAAYEPAEPTIVFGVRPCDAAGLVNLDLVFLGDPVDAAYKDRRDALTIVGLSCASPYESCFCTVVGGSPTGTEGSDILLTPVGDKVLVEILTEKGAALAKQLGSALSAGDLDKTPTTQAAAAKIARKPLPADLPAKLAANFGHPGWKVEAERCVGCGTCAFVCPTCHCFDIVDDSNVRTGSRERNWDACQLGRFTQHGSGYNPRPDQGARYRQRVLRKFDFPQRYDGRYMCVGCGRCIAHCPVGMDIEEVAEKMGAATMPAPEPAGK